MVAIHVKPGLNKISRETQIASLEENADTFCFIRAPCRATSRTSLSKVALRHISDLEHWHRTGLYSLEALQAQIYNRVPSRAQLRSLNQPVKHYFASPWNPGSSALSAEHIGDQGVGQQLGRPGSHAVPGPNRVLMQAQLHSLLSRVRRDSASLQCQIMREFG